MQKIFIFNRLPSLNRQSSGCDREISEKSWVLHVIGDSRCRIATSCYAPRRLISGFPAAAIQRFGGQDRQARRAGAACILAALNPGPHPRQSPAPIAPHHGPRGCALETLCEAKKSRHCAENFHERACRSVQTFFARKQGWE
jgi:hypothetical protein